MDAEAIKELIRFMEPIAVQMCGQAIENLVKREAVANFYKALAILTNQADYNSKEIEAAIYMTAVLMPKEHQMEYADYLSDAGIAKLQEMKDALDSLKQASKED